MQGYFLDFFTAAFFVDEALNLIIATALKRLSAVAFVIIGIVKDLP